MISRRNFALITAMMLVVLFMFQATGVAKDQWNDAEKNEYAELYRTDQPLKELFSPEKGRESAASGTGDPSAHTVAHEHKRMILFIGKKEQNAIADTVVEWCTYSKRELKFVPDVMTCQEYLDKAEMVLVDSRSMNIETDVEQFDQILAKGINVIFCNLPDVEQIILYPNFQRLVGITGVAEKEVELEGIHLFSGLIIGGERIYQVEKPEQERLQDMELHVPWYITLNATKAFMVGMLENMGNQEGQTKNEYAPNLIWRNSASGSGQVYVVNGDFLENQAGIGILEGMACDMYLYEIYPIVNAQSLSVVNYPSFAEENSEKMQKLYSREVPILYRDIIFQSLSSVTERNRQKITALMSPQNDYSDGIEPTGDYFTYFARLFNEKRTEIGLSLDQISDIPLEEKIERDISFLHENLPDYIYRAVYAPELNDEIRQLMENNEYMSDVTTVLAGYEDKVPLLSYEKKRTIQKVTSDAYHHTYTENFRIRSIESALGYSSIVVDMQRVAYPQSEKDNWEKLDEEFAANVLTYWNDYSLLEKTTLSQSDVRIRRFLSLDYAMEREDDCLKLAVDNFEQEAFFILRIQDETPVEITGGEVTELEEGVYLISCSEDYVEIKLEPDSLQRYH